MTPAGLLPQAGTVPARPAADIAAAGEQRRCGPAGPVPAAAGCRVVAGDPGYPARGLRAVAGAAVPAGQSAQPARPPAGPGQPGELAGGSARRQLAGPVAGQRCRTRAGLAGPGRRLEDARTGMSPAGTDRPAHAGAGLLTLIGADVIRPSARWLLTCPAAPRNLAAEMARIRDPAAFAGLAALCQSGSVGAFARLAALGKIAVIMAAKGGLPAGITVGDCVELLEVVAAVAHRGRPARQQPVLLPAAALLGCLRPGRARGDAGARRPRAADLRAADRPLPHRLPAGPRRAGRLPARTPGRRGLLLAAAPGLPARQAVLGRPGGPPSRHQLAQAAPRRQPPHGSSA